MFALLRAGTASPDAAVVVCGTGINGAAVRADGASARILALGHVSGDWGGASGLAEEVLWHAARAEDGRGEPTALRDALLSWTGMASVHEVVVAVHRGELAAVVAGRRGCPRSSRSPVRATPSPSGWSSARARRSATSPDPCWRGWACAEAAVPVVLGGGIGASGDERLEAAVRRALAARSAYAELSVVVQPPVVGAIELALADGRARVG